jgi:hypothetical protein
MGCAWAARVETMQIPHHYQGAPVLVRLQEEAHGKMKSMDAALRL